MKKKKKKTIITSYDYYILSIYIILMIIGLFMQLNISSIRTSMMFFYKQSIWFVLSLISLWFAFRIINLEKCRRLIFPILFLVIISLVFVLISGSEIKGAQRSFSFMGVNIQPSLLARIILILYFAHILDKKRDVIDDTKPKQFLAHFNSLIIISILVFGLIFAGKHLSILIILGSTIFWMLWLSKIHFSTISVIVGVMFLGILVALIFGKNYRRERIEIFEQYSLFHKYTGQQKVYEGDKDYQIRESLISLASGKLFGTTPKRGTGKHYFLPEAKTDYIFAIVGEEFGFLVASLVIGLYVLLFFRVIKNAQKTDSLFLKLTGYGLGMNIFFNAMVNVGVAMSALPSTGVTLPFISYGGTSLLVNSFSVGLLLNISSTRKVVR